MDFNRDVADWVYGLVSKMDDGEARMFTVFLAEDLQKTDIKNNARLIERTHEAVTKAMTDELANDFLYRLEHGEHPERLVAEAAAVAIAKTDYTGWKFQSRDHGRWGPMTHGQYRAGKRVIAAMGDTAEAKARADELETNYRFRYGDATKQVGEDVGPHVQRFEDQWNKRASAQSSATDTFNRINAAGQITSVVGGATDQPSIWAAGQAAALVGQFGPEAEKVVGPSVRRTAYRYRGTERKPEEKEIHAEANEFAQREFPTEYDSKGKWVESSDGTKRKVRVPTGQGMAPLRDLKSGAARPTPLQRLDEPQRDYAMQVGAIRHLKNKLPSSALANLHIESGKIPPSEGVIINDQGKVTAQSVGFAEDHYLPFNLRNLGELQGGRYVRTRTTGGPTSEDIHAAVASGARSFTVVSRSGAFTVDFADDFRGARRNSDKAKSMVDRYERTLDAVRSEQVRRLPITDRDRANAVAEVQAEMQALADNPQSGFNPATYTKENFDAAVEERLLQKPQQPSLTKAEYDSIEDESKKLFDMDTEKGQKQQKFAFNQMVRRARGEKEDANFKLDGAGYKSALDALKEQYPYFIADVRVVNAADDPELFSEGKDRGYVKPRHLHPTAVKTGYFGTGIEKPGASKRSAETIHYQNWPVRRSMQDDQPDTPDTDQPPAPRAAVTPAEHAARGQAAGQITRAEKERDESTVKAADFWVRALPDDGNPPPEIAALAQYRLHQDKAAFVAQRGDALRQAIDRVRAMPSVASVVASAPQVVDNVAAATRAASAAQPPGAGPIQISRTGPLNKDDADRLIQRGFLQRIHDSTGQGRALVQETAETAKFSDDEFGDTINVIRQALATETNPNQKMAFQNRITDIEQILAYRTAQRAQQGP